MTDNKVHPFMGGNIEQVPAGETDIFDEQTGQMKHFTWKNHVKVTCILGKMKLNKAAVQALVNLYQEDTDFKTWVDDLCP